MLAVDFTAVVQDNIGTTASILKQRVTNRAPASGCTIRDLLGHFWESVYASATDTFLGNVSTLSSIIAETWEPGWKGRSSIR